MLPANLELFSPIPEDTANAAQLVIRAGNPYLSIGSLANQLFCGLTIDKQADELQIPRQSLARLYLITIFQFTESLADEGAVEALQKRVDWKYALHLSLDYQAPQGIEFIKLRRWLLEKQVRLETLQCLSARISEITQGSSKLRRSKSGSDIIYQICLSNGLATVWGVMSDVLHVLAIERPGCLESIYKPHWYQRYEKFPRFLDLMTASLDQLDLVQAIGYDGMYLLKAISECQQADLRHHPKVEHLRQVWDEQYTQAEGKIEWRKESWIYGLRSTELQPSTNYFSKGDLP